MSEPNADSARVKTLTAHLFDSDLERRLLFQDRYECRLDLEALVDVLVPKCAFATDENADARMILLEIRNILAVRLLADEEWNTVVWAERDRILKQQQNDCSGVPDRNP